MKGFGNNSVLLLLRQILREPSKCLSDYVFSPVRIGVALEEAYLYLMNRRGMGRNARTRASLSERVTAS